ncbi:DedA family protein [Sphingomonas sp. BT-65]|uniref:DedA family protein n=1 Tax=Sphingomonas sp. BT-65 TaxID=2989821 RepID=UPI0022369F7F|nr:DedA family protein [Sphingomonas sp. BT-65]MCW4460323.1 DedA family protein [Sphingomonas sp. BT-65]
MESFLAEYGVFAILVSALFQGELAVAMGGVLVHQDVVSASGAIGAGSLAAFSSSQGFFFLGRSLRDHAFVRRMIARPGFARAKALFERHPGSFMIGYHFLPGFQAISPLAIGTTAISGTRFALLNAIASILWSNAFTGLGYALGNSMEFVLGELRLIEHLLLGVAVVLALFLIGRRLAHRWAEARTLNRAAAAPPASP